MGIEWEILYSAAKPEGGRLRWHHGSSFINSKDGGGGLVDVLEQPRLELAPRAIVIAAGERPGGEVGFELAQLVAVDRQVRRAA